ncbi:MAG: metal-dependent hydrolase [Candidatus Gracilibacteria bacterium]|nr:metal-dependent hydrolase [Candidatus Gracilibacteria bacterium]
MKITYHSHSFIEIVIDSGSILIDPFITGNPTIKSKVEDFFEKTILAVVLTHGHNDHIGDTEIICKKTGCLLISTFELSNYFAKVKGLINLHPMHIGGEFDFGEYKVKYTPAVHGGGVADMISGYTTNPAGVIIRAKGKNLSDKEIGSYREVSIYHAGDTGLTYDMKLLGDYDKIDIAFLPIGGNFTMGIDDAVIATRDFIKPKIVIPIHYNTFGLIKANPEEFVKKVGNIGKIINFGESIIL